METFNFPLHSFQIKYPEPAPAIQFGRGYSFGVKPLLPISRTFILNFESMRWYSDDDWTTVTAVTDPQRNMKTLMDFYEAHLTWKRFIYSNELVGSCTVRFAQPLTTPKALKGGFGWTEPFELQLVEQSA